MHPLHHGVQPWHSQHRLPEPPAWHPGGEGSHRIQHTAVPSWAGAVQGLQLGKERETKGKSLSHCSRRFGFRSEARIVSESRDAAWAAVGGGRALHPHGEVMAMCVIMQLWHCCRQRAQRPRHQSHTLESSVLHEGSLFNGLISKTGKKKIANVSSGCRFADAVLWSWVHVGKHRSVPCHRCILQPLLLHQHPRTPPERSGFCCSPSLNPLR